MSAKSSGRDFLMKKKVFALTLVLLLCAASAMAEISVGGGPYWPSNDMLDTGWSASVAGKISQVTIKGTKLDIVGEYTHIDGLGFSETITGPSVQRTINKVSLNLDVRADVLVVGLRKDFGKIKVSVKAGAARTAYDMSVSGYKGTVTESDHVTKFAWKPEVTWTPIDRLAISGYYLGTGESLSRGAGVSALYTIPISL